MIFYCICIRLKIFHRIGNGPFSNQIMDDHVCLQDTLDNHRTQLCKYIIELCVNTRLFNEANKMSEKDKYIRTKFTKLILFNNQ